MVGVLGMGQGFEGSAKAWDAASVLAPRGVFAGNVARMLHFRVAEDVGERDPVLPPSQQIARQRLANERADPVR